MGPYKEQTKRHKAWERHTSAAPSGQAISAYPPDSIQRQEDSGFPNQSSLTHLTLILDEMNRLKVPLTCTSQGIDTSEQNACGSFQIAVLMAVAEIERAIIRERVNSGLAAAKAKGVRLGRPKTLERRQDEVMALKNQGRSIREIARKLKIPACSVFKLTKPAKEAAK